MDVLSFPPSRLTIEGPKVPDLRAELNRVIDFHDGAVGQAPCHFKCGVRRPPKGSRIRGSAPLAAGRVLATVAVGAPRGFNGTRSAGGSFRGVDSHGRTRHSAYQHLR
jgi:hypothetical protein